MRFEISRLDSSGITITCSQSGGQQIGELNAGVPILSRKNPNTLALKQVQPLMRNYHDEQWYDIEFTIHR